MSALRRVVGWSLLLLGALLAFSGAIDLAVGPELQELETGVQGPRWYGLIIIGLGAGLAFLGHRLTRPTKEDA